MARAFSPPPAWTHMEVVPEVREALLEGHPVVALESAVITHGLPAPYNVQAALDMAQAVRAAGAIPAIIALWEGRLVVGLEPAQVTELAHIAHEVARQPHYRMSARAQAKVFKVSVRDLGPLLARAEASLFGGTTVAATLAVAAQARIRFFATGGIGGVHWQPPYDVSADLPQLAYTRVLTVAAGAKAILNLDATLEYLETWGVPVVGYRSDTFPAFYSANSPWKVRHRVDTPEEAARLARVHWDMGMPSAVLLAVPPPARFAMEYEEMRRLIRQAQAELEQWNREHPQQAIRGPAVTPFLLQRLTELSDERTLHINLALLRHNAQVAGEVARAWVALFGEG